MAIPDYPMKLRLLLGLWCGVLGAAAAGGAAAADGRPNIVLIFADDLGYGDLGCFGHPTIRTPQLDRLAREGVRMTSFYSAPVCVPARVQLMLGKYSGRVELGGTGPGGGGGIPDSETTLAQALQAAGYETAMVGKWHLGSAQPKYLPTGRGFGTWFGLPYSNDMIKPWVQTDVPLRLYENERPVEHPVNLETLPQRYAERAVEIVRKKRSAPFFLYFAPAMPHLPLAAGAAFRGKSAAGLYGDVIEEIDWSVGRILEALRETGQERNTIVVFTSDNGPWNNLPPRMLQQGNQPWHTGSTGGLRQSKATTYEGGVRVPAILRWPGRIPADWSTAEIAGTIDLYATLVRAGTGAAPRHRIDGVDLTDFLAGRTPKSPREEWFYFSNRTVDGVRVGPWKLRVRDGVELFDLGSDPGEKYNRAEEFPERVAELKAKIDAMVQTVPAGKKR